MHVTNTLYVFLFFINKSIDVLFQALQFVFKYKSNINHFTKKKKKYAKKSLNK